MKYRTAPNAIGTPMTISTKIRAGRGKDQNALKPGRASSPVASHTPAAMNPATVKATAHASTAMRAFLTTSPLIVRPDARRSPVHGPIGWRFGTRFPAARRGRATSPGGASAGFALSHTDLHCRPSGGSGGWSSATDLIQTTGGGDTGLRLTLTAPWQLDMMFDGSDLCPPLFPVGVGVKRPLLPLFEFRTWWRRRELNPPSP